VLLTEGVVNVTAAVSVKLPTVTVTVFVSTVVDVNDAVKTPEVLVLPLVGDKVLFEPVAAMETAWALTGLPCASNTVVVSVLVLVPSAATEVGLADRLVVPLLAAPATNVTFVVAPAAPAVAVIVLASALVEVMVAVNTPDVVIPEAGENVLLDPVLLSDTA
jgi:hypothetical protein